MADPPRPSGPERPATPRWVKVFGLVAVALVVLVLVAALVGVGEHGPGRHLPPDGPEASIPGGHTPPPGIPGHD